MKDVYPFIACPKRDRPSKSFVWSGLIVKTTCKGLSVFATETIEPGLILPYGGKEIDESEYVRLRKKAGTNRFNYIVGEKSIIDISTSKPIYRSWFDAHPTNYKGSFQHAWIGSLINEPNLTESVNCQLYLETNGKALPAYPFIKCSSNGCCVVVEIVKRINAGSELLLDYGWDPRDRQRHQRYQTATTIPVSIRKRPSTIEDITQYSTMMQQRGKHMNDVRRSKKQRSERDATM